MNKGVSTRIIIIVCCFFTINIARAQEHKVTKKTIEYQQLEDPSYQSKNNGLFLNEFGLTIDPIRLFSGELPVSLEYAPFDWLLLEVGTGLTYRNFFGSALGISSITDRPDQINYKLHPMFLTGFKISPSGGVFMDDFFVGYEIRYRTYGGETVISNDNGDYLANYNQHLTDHTLVFGYFYEVGANMYIEYSVGFSARRIRSETEPINNSQFESSNSKGDLNAAFIVSLRFGWLLN